MLLLGERQAALEAGLQNNSARPPIPPYLVSRRLNDVTGGDSGLADRLRCRFVSAEAGTWR